MYICQERWAVFTHTVCINNVWEFKSNFLRRDMKMDPWGAFIIYLCLTTEIGAINRECNYIGLKSGRML